MSIGTGMTGRHLPVAQTTIWLTPPHILEALGEFDLDPCAAPEPRPWPTAREHITLPRDGRAAPWRGSVWLNPPYGLATGEWLAKLADHGNGVALIFARTETEMFHAYVWQRATAILFLRGRLNFHTREGKRFGANAGAPSCLVAYGWEARSRLLRCKLPGYLVDLDR